jgi:hypothetical protein
MTTDRHDFHPWTQPLTWRRAAIIAIGLAACMLIIACQIAPDRVGDGAEYYSLYLAIKDGHQPFMTETAFQAYDHLLKSNQIPGLLDTARMRHAFPSLIQGDTADFNHFWFYPALAVLAGGWIDAAGAGPHVAFLFLHALLFGVVLFTSGRAYGRAGIVAALVVTLASPMVWFFNKVHTEFFTYCCVAIASTWFARRHYFAAAVALAVASTQNISMAAAAGFALALGAWEAGWLRRNIRWQDVLLATLTVALVALHPVYYLCRIGVIDPQLLAGGAKIGTNLGSILIWLVDPDVGLVPNWPLSLVIIALGVRAMRRGGRPSWQMSAFVAIFLITNLYAQASTQNLNSGATVYIARYATWYIGLFVPLLGFGLASLRHVATWRVEAAATLLCIATVVNGVIFTPTRHETYMQPTTISEELQLHLPHFYNPPPQIFWERFSRRSIEPRSFAVFGPDCAKVLVVEQAGFPVEPQPGPYCKYDASALPARVFHLTRWQGTIQDGRRYRYIYLTPAEQESARPAFRVGLHYVPNTSEVRTLDFFKSGWYPREPNGVWTQGDHAEIDGLVDTCPAQGLRLVMTLTPSVTPRNPSVRVTANVRGREVGKYDMDRGDRVTFDIPCDAVPQGELKLDLHIEGWMSPLTAGSSTDWRELGMFLTEFWFEPMPAKKP